MHNHVLSCQNLSATKIIMFSYLPKTHHDYTTLENCDIINSGLFHALITSYIQANIYRFIYSTWLSKYYQKNILINHTHTHTHTQTHTHTHTHTHIYIYIYIYAFTNQGHTNI